ncbi:MAG TPA: DUF2079 domain-containing protein [Chloroflexota bacterium]|nr:DUF2079 domain-containing protein [Chloroflexota bacterium]
MANPSRSLVADPIPAPADCPPSPRARLLEAGLWITLILAIAYIFIFAAVSILRYVNFHYGGDTADYAQMLWNTDHGRILWKTNIYTAGNGFRGGHAEPLLLLLAIPYAIGPDPRTLLLLQTLALASGGPLTYLLARIHGHRQSTSVGLAGLYLVFPLVHYANIWDFHPDPFAVPALFGALIAFDLRRWKLLAGCLVVVLLTKEQMGLFVVGLGAYWWFWRGERKVGQLVIGAALLYGLVVLLPWMLATSGQFSRDYGSYFSDAGSAAHAHGLLGRLEATGSLLSQGFRGQNLILALLPTGFLFLFDGSAMVTVLPLAGLYVSNQFTNDFWFHHYVTCVPIFLYGTSRVLLRPVFRRYRAVLPLALIIWASLLGYSYAASALNMMHWIYQPAIFLSTDAHARAQSAFIRFVPAGAPLDSDSPIAAHLANRETLYQVQNPDQPSLVPYTLLDLHADLAHPPPWLVQDDDLTRAYIVRTGGFKVIHAIPKQGLYLYANCRNFPHAIGCQRH